MEGLYKKYPIGDWGQRRPVVIRRAFSKVDVKAEVAHALSATYLVRQGMMWGGLRLGVGLAVGGGGVGVTRNVGGPAGHASGRRSGGSQQTGGHGVGGGATRCYGCGKQGHIRSACPTNGPRCYGCGKQAHIRSACPTYGPRCYGCGVIGHLSYSCPSLSLTRMDASGKPVVQAGNTGGDGMLVLKRPGSATFGGAKYPAKRRGAPQGARTNA